MSPVFSPSGLLIFIVSLLLPITIVQVGMVSISLERLGLPQESAMLLLFSLLFGSAVHLPLRSLKIKAPPMCRQRMLNLVFFHSYQC